MRLKFWGAELLNRHKLFVYCSRQDSNICLPRNGTFLRHRQVAPVAAGDSQTRSDAVDAIDGAARIEDLRLPPSNRLEILAQDRAGQRNNRINE